MELTRGQILDLHNGLNNVGDLTGVQFAYAISKNIFKIKSEIEIIRKAFQLSPEIVEYEGKKVDLSKKLNKEDFDKEIKVLQKEYTIAIEAKKKQQVKGETLLEEKVKVDLHMIPQNYIPKEITVKQMSGILTIVNKNLTN